MELEFTRKDYTSEHGRHYLTRRLNSNLYWFDYYYPMPPYVGKFYIPYKKEIMYPQLELFPPYLDWGLKSESLANIEDVGQRKPAGAPAITKSKRFALAVSHRSSQEGEQRNDKTLNENDEVRGVTKALSRSSGSEPDMTYDVW